MGAQHFSPQIVRQHPEARSKDGDPVDTRDTAPRRPSPQDPISMSRDRHLRRSRSGSPTGRRPLGRSPRSESPACSRLPPASELVGPRLDAGVGRARAPAPAAPVTTRPTTYVTAGARGGSGVRPLPGRPRSHAPIASLPVRSGSAATIAAIGPSETISPVSAPRRGWARARVPTNLIDSRTAPRSFIAVASMYQSVSENQSVPWPDDPASRGGPTGRGTGTCSPSTPPLRVLGADQRAGARRERLRGAPAPGSWARTGSSASTSSNTIP